MIKIYIDVENLKFDFLHDITNLQFLNDVKNLLYIIYSEEDLKEFINSINITYTINTKDNYKIKIDLDLLHSNSYFNNYSTNIIDNFTLNKQLIKLLNFKSKIKDILNDYNSLNYHSIEIYCDTNIYFYFKELKIEFIINMCLSYKEFIDNFDINNFIENLYMNFKYNKITINIDTNINIQFINGKDKNIVEYKITKRTPFMDYDIFIYYSFYKNNVIDKFKVKITKITKCIEKIFIYYDYVNNIKEAYYKKYYKDNNKPIKITLLLEEYFNKEEIDDMLKLIIFNLFKQSNVLNFIENKFNSTFTNLNILNHLI